MVLTVCVICSYAKTKVLLKRDKVLLVFAGLAKVVIRTTPKNGSFLVFLGWQFDLNRPVRWNLTFAHAHSLRLTLHIASCCLHQLPPAKFFSQLTARENENTSFALYFWKNLLAGTVVFPTPITRFHTRKFYSTQVHMFVYIMKRQMTVFLSSNIHTKISAFWLAESMSINPKQCKTWHFFRAES